MKTKNKKIIFSMIACISIIAMVFIITNLFSSQDKKNNGCINHNWVFHNGDSVTTNKYNNDGTQAYNLYCSVCKTNYSELAESKPWKTDYAGQTEQYWKNYEDDGYVPGDIAEIWHNVKYNCYGKCAGGAVSKTYKQPSYYKCSKCGCIKTTDNNYGMTSIISQGSQLYDINGKSLGKKATNIEVNINRYCWQNGLIAKYFTYDSKYNTCTGDTNDDKSKDNAPDENKDKTQPNYSWKQDSKGWYYAASDGSYIKNAWKQISGTWYYFGSDGYRLSNDWHNSNGKWYYFNKNGAMVTSKWIESGGKWYYLCSDGSMDYSEYRQGYWLNADGSWNETYSGGHWIGNNDEGWWYADGSYYPKNGSLWIDGKNYHFDSKGWCTNPY